MLLSRSLKEDINYTITNNAHLLDKFKDSHILITGATGLVARILAITLLEANTTNELNLHLFLVVRNRDKAVQIYHKWLEAGSVSLIVQDVRSEIKCRDKMDFIFHAAAVTNSQALISYPIEAFETQILGMENVLNLVNRDNARLLYFSSMEIYGRPFVKGTTYEKDLGYVDPLVVRSGYPEAKRSCEFLGRAWVHEKGAFVVNARLAQTFGPGVQIQDDRVFVQFIKSAMRNEDLVLHTDGLSLGNYCYLRDTVEALLLLIVNGENGNSYNVVNESTNISIKGMAELVSNEFGNGKVIVNIPNTSMGYAPEVNLHLGGKKIRKLGWKPTYDLKEMFARTINSFKELGVM